MIALYGTVNPVLTKVITPIFAAIQQEKKKVRQLYLDIVESLAFINMPVYCLIAVFSMGILLVVSFR